MYYLTQITIEEVADIIILYLWVGKLTFRKV